MLNAKSFLSGTAWAGDFGIESEDTLVFLRGNAFPPDVGCRLRILAFLSGSRTPFR